MKNFLNKKFSLAISSVMICTTPFAFTSLTSCGGNPHAVQFANFESYMDPTLMDYLTDTYDVQYQWYTVTEMIETKFHRVYDVAAPSGYELVALFKKGWLEKINWEKFEIEGVYNSQDALNLFAPKVQAEILQMNTTFTRYLLKEGVIPPGATFNVLDYGVPYFAQTLEFVYKGTPVTFYKDGTSTPTATPKWADIFYTAGPYNPNISQDDRFTKRIGMLDDAKTLYDISRIMEVGNNEMPSDAKIPDLINTYQQLTSRSKYGWYTLNTDSGVISRNLADHSEHAYVGAITWSGDALYSALGAGEFDPYEGGQMHIQPASDASLNEIEFLVINKKNEENEEKNNRIYQLINDICLSGCKATDIGAMDGDHYKYWSMQNFDTVNYTPPLNTIYQYVTNPDSPYWSDYSDEQKALYISILEVPQAATTLFGRTLSSEQNSNTHWAWLQSRGNL